jgi:hypothetical protein
VTIIRTIGLAAIAALALTAWLGAGSATAAETTLCKSAADVPLCSAANRYAAGTTFQATTEEAIISTSLVSVECKSSMEGKTNTQSGNPLGITITSWSLDSCTTVGGTDCVVENNNAKAPYAGSVTWTSSDDGDLSVKSAGSGAPSWLLECGAFMHCTFSSQPTLSMNGGNPGEIVASSEPMSTEGGFFCPSKVEGLSAVYSVKSPQPMYVTKAVEEAANWRLCAEPWSSFCPTASSYPAGTTITAANSGNLVIETNVVTITCKEASIKATTQALGAKPLPIQLSAYSLNGCSTLGGSCETQTAISSPGYIVKESSWYLNTGAVSLTFECGLFSCTYVSSGIFHQLIGGNPATLNVSSTINPGSKYCPKTSTLKAKFTVTAPTPLYPV